MSVRSWTKPLKAVKPYIFKIYTPNGRGTGFQIAHAQNKGLFGIATALHVISHAHEWEEPLKLVHYSTNTTKIIRNEDRVIFTYPNKDLAFIIISKIDFPIESKDLEMIPPEKRITQGVQMGWCGFPSVSPNDLCFFTGHMSSWLANEQAYLVDGVAINGVSGGPAFTIYRNKPRICGVVTAYVPNRATGEALPGVCLIKDVSPFKEKLKALSSMEEAAKKATVENGVKSANDLTDFIL